MRSLIIIGLLAVICLGVASCPKGHKSFGGSSLLLGSNSLPDGPGAFIKIGSEQWTTDGLNRRDHPIDVDISGSIFGPSSWHKLCDESKFDSQAISASQLQYCYQAVSGATVSEMEVGAMLYRLDRKDGKLFVSESRTDNGNLQISWPNNHGAFLVKINITVPGDYLFAAGPYDVFIRR